MTRALIVGITGQDGSYLAELLLAKGYEVHGLIRRSSSFNTARIDHVFDRLHLHYGDLTDGMGLSGVLARVQPDEIYNLGAQSHVRVSFDQPVYTANVVALGTLRLLEAVRAACPEAKFYQASSSEMFGSAPAPQSEETRFHPRSPYAAAKVFAFDAVRNYREAYGLFAANGVLFNHESPRRGETFVTRKITRAAARIRAGLQAKLVLGDLAPRRDWGFAGDYVEAMWQMLQHPEPLDLVIGTGVCHSVEEWLAEAFGWFDLDWREYVETDQRYRRPAEVDELRADPRKAETLLGWKPSVWFAHLVGMMCSADAIIAEREKASA